MSSKLGFKTHLLHHAKHYLCCCDSVFSSINWDDGTSFVESLLYLGGVILVKHLDQCQHMENLFLSIIYERLIYLPERQSYKKGETDFQSTVHSSAG